ncbi:DMT family transporter [Silicimonas algicola]|nr:DMT family transporter [Silicimonas algicola]AZQ66515.1 DMT family transporter [Silicimonas algicola]
MRIDAAPTPAPFVGALWAMLAVACFSTTDVLVKFLSDGYALYEVMFIRTLFGILFLLGVILPLTRASLRISRVWLHLARGLCVFVANLFFFLGLAAMPLSEATAIFFVSPLLISAFSVWFLHETVGPRRWIAIAVGLVGVVVVLRPGTEAFQAAALLPLFAATGYALLHTITRAIGATENATAMALTIQLTFLVISGAAGMLLGHGGYDVFDHPSAHFLLRAWTWPATSDVWLLALLGVSSAMGGFSISEAFRRAEAAFVAPFEYIALPMAVFFDLTVFGVLPDTVAFAGIALILVSGLVLIWREAVARRREVLDAPNRL